MRKVAHYWLKVAFLSFIKAHFKSVFSPTVAITSYLTSFDSGCVSVGVLTIINPAAAAHQSWACACVPLGPVLIASSFFLPGLCMLSFHQLCNILCVLIQRVFLRLNFLSPSIISDVVQPSRHAAEDPPSSSVGTDSSSCSSRPARSSEEAAWRLAALGFLAGCCWGRWTPAFYFKVLFWFQEKLCSGFISLSPLFVVLCLFPSFFPGTDSICGASLGQQLNTSYIKVELCCCCSVYASIFHPDPSSASRQAPSLLFSF